MRDLLSTIPMKGGRRKLWFWIRRQALRDMKTAQALCWVRTTTKGTRERLTKKNGEKGMSQWTVLSLIIGVMRRFASA
eukprot:329272-Prorocentrum_lima.AAC.1